MGMREVPIPGASQNFLEGRKSWSPTEFTTDFVRTRDQYGRIAWTRKRLTKRNLHTADLCRSGNYLANTEAHAVAQIVDQSTGRFERIEYCEMCGCEVVNVNEVAHAGSIRSRIVSPKNRNRAAGAKGRAQHIW